MTDWPKKGVAGGRQADLSRQCRGGCRLPGGAGGAGSRTVREARETRGVRSLAAPRTLPPDTSQPQPPCSRCASRRAPQRSHRTRENSPKGDLYFPWGTRTVIETSHARSRGVKQGNSLLDKTLNHLLPAIYWQAQSTPMRQPSSFYRMFVEKSWNPATARDKVEDARSLGVVGVLDRKGAIWERSVGSLAWHDACRRSSKSKKCLQGTHVAHCGREKWGVCLRARSPQHAARAPCRGFFARVNHVPHARGVRDSCARALARAHHGPTRHSSPCVPCIPYPPDPLRRVFGQRDTGRRGKHEFRRSQRGNGQEGHCRP